jgi:uncharacterized protein YciI
MRPRFVCSLLILVVTLAPLARAVEHPPAHKIKVVVTPTDPDLAIYYVGLLTKGPHAGEGTKQERQAIQAAQNDYISQLAKDGKLLVAGPIDDRSEWRGIYIFKCGSLADAKALAQADPEVKAGRLQIEVHPWLTEKGAIRDPEFPPAK